MITEDELAAIMADHARYADPWEYRDLAETVADHVPALVAEVRRLRQALAPLVDDPPERDANGYRVCRLCGGMGAVLAAPPAHRDGCPVPPVAKALAGDAATAGPATGG